jgi:riboflavin synthase
MFTGIISDVGTVIALQQRGDLGARIATAYDSASIDIGASIACDGVCLTVIATGNSSGNSTGDTDAKSWFDVEISQETLSRTNISRHSNTGSNGWQVGTRINLERALRLGDELGGHIVSGHVDGLARITAIDRQGDSTRIALETPADLARFIAQKGSVALNGVSLTVNEAKSTSFTVNIIPHTKTHTTLGTAQVGDMINLEIDTLARYVARLSEMQAT